MENTITELKKILKKVHLKATPGHLAILSYIKNAKKPVSSQDIISHLQKKLDPATVYRCIKKLKERQLVRQIDLRQNHAHYEFFDMKHHHHIACIHCGRLEDIHHCGIEAMHENILKKTKHFSQLRHHSLEFYGVCRVCEKKIKKQPH